MRNDSDLGDTNQTESVTGRILGVGHVLLLSSVVLEKPRRLFKNTFYLDIYNAFAILPEG